MCLDEKSEQPREEDAVFTTIVGGRPAGSGTQVGEIPRGIEVLVKKASVDPEFRRLLLKERGEAARRIDLELADTERSMLSSIPAEQLEKIIDNTKVKPEHREIFLGAVGKLMLALVIGTVVVGVMTTSFGHTLTPEQRDRILRERTENMKSVEDANDPNEAYAKRHIISFGMRMDRPPEPARPWLRLPSEQSRKQDVAREYVVRSGDSLWLIAAQQLGDGSRCEEILKLNPDLPQDGGDLKPGMVLVIPAE